MAGNATSKFSAPVGEPKRIGAPEAPLLLVDRNTAAIGALLVESRKQPDTGINPTEGDKS
jgi:hypothetical protein